MGEIQKPELNANQLALVINSFDLPSAIARRFFGQSFTKTDLESLGHEALIRCALRFDPSRGVSFEGYASKRVEGAMLDGLRDHDLPIRPRRKDSPPAQRVKRAVAELNNGETRVSDEDIAASTRLSEVDVRHFRNAPRTPQVVSLFKPMMNLSHGSSVELIELLVGEEDPAASIEISVAVQAELDKLSPEQGDLLRFRFGIDPFDEPHSQPEAAQYFERSEDSIFRLEKAAKAAFHILAAPLMTS